MCVCFFFFLSCFIFFLYIYIRHFSTVSSRLWKKRNVTFGFEGAREQRSENDPSAVRVATRFTRRDAHTCTLKTPFTKRMLPCYWTKTGPSHPAPSTMVTRLVKLDTYDALVTITYTSIYSELRIFPDRSL